MIFLSLFKLKKTCSKDSKVKMSISTFISAFDKWKKALDDNFLRYNLTLYQLKYIYEKDLKNPSLFPEQECLKPCDLLFIHRYLYNSKEYKIEELENNFEDEYKGDRELVASNIISNLTLHGQVRVGFFTRSNNDNPTYLLLSSHIEDEKYYTKYDDYMYDTFECTLWYMVRYNFDSDVFYMLSGMTKMDKNHMSKYGLDDFPICPYKEDNRKKFYEEYFESFDLTNIFSEFNKLPSISSISNDNYDEIIKIYKETDKICQKYKVSKRAYQYFKEVSNLKI